MASEDGHRDGHSRECGTRWCRSLGLLGRPGAWGWGPTADFGPGATAAGHRAEDQEAPPAPPELAQPDGAPSHAGWSKDAGGRPEPRGTARPKVGHQRHPGGPAQTAWESPGLSWRSQTIGCRSRSSEADRGPPGEPTPWRNRTQIPDQPLVSKCPPAVRLQCPKRRQGTAGCPTRGPGDREGCVSDSVCRSQSRFLFFRKEEVSR